MNDLKKKIEKFKKFINKNQDFLTIIVVSKDFMLKLKQEADMVDFEKKVIINPDEKDEDQQEKDVWYLFGVPVIYSNTLENGCIIEDSKGESIVFDNF